MKYEYWKSPADRQWYWHLKADNGEKIAQSEGYTRKSNCLRAIRLVKASAASVVTYASGMNPVPIYENPAA